MPDLATFQLAFAAAMGRDPGRCALERQPGFAVYRNTSPSALVDALRATFPVVAAIVGDEAFAAAALDYIDHHPPATPVLTDYGAEFAAYLQVKPWTSELPYLAEVAALERLRAEAHVAADAPALDGRDLALLGGSGWNALRLRLHPAARFAWLRTPAMTIWLAHQGDGFDSLAPEWRPEGALFTRPAGAVEAAAIDAAGWIFLRGLRLGWTFGQASAAVADVHPEADIAGLFATLVNRGAFLKPPHLERN